MTAIEAWKDKLEQRLAGLSRDIEANNATTNSIKSDTGEIVVLFRASKFGAMLVKWCAGVGATIIVAYASWKGIK